MRAACEAGDFVAVLPPQIAEARPEIYRLIGRAISGPVCDAIERLIAFAESDPEAVRQHIQSIPIDKISNPTAHLPPDWGNPLSGDTLMPAPDAPDDQLRQRIVQLGDIYWQPHINHSMEVPGDHETTEFSRQKLLQALYFWIRSGGVIEPDSWTQNQETYMHQLERGFETLCRTAAHMREDYGNPFNDNFRGFEYLTGRHDESLIATTGIANQIARQVRSPIGFYGEDNARDSLRATVFMMHFLWSDPQLRNGIWQRLHNENHPEYNERYYDVLRHHTMRANARMRWGSLEESVVATIVEGAMSVSSVVRLRTAEHADGYDGKNDYGRLVKDLAERKSARYTTILASLSLAGLSERQGLYMPGLSGLEIRADATRTLTEVREHARSVIDAEWAAFGATYEKAQKKYGWSSYYDYLAALTKELASAAFDTPIDAMGVLHKNGEPLPRPPIRTNSYFCPVVGRASDSNNAIAYMEQALPILLDCVRDMPDTHVLPSRFPRLALDGLVARLSK